MPQGTFDQGDGDAPNRIEIDDVTFSYEPDTPVLKGVSFTAEPGTMTAFIRPPGGDKFTLVRLVARSHDVGQRAAGISGVNVQEATLAWLLPRVATMLQDIALANGPVFDNAMLGGLDTTRRRVEAAARTACVHDWIMRLPKGYDTVLDEESGFLFGGERQRVTFARAYLQDAPILVLDETTTQADPQSGHDIHQALMRPAEDRIVIIIAHRLTIVRDADQILVLEDGQIAERGRHDDLVAANGRYTTMWRNQSLAPSAAAAREE